MTMSARLKSYLDENKIHYTVMTHSPAYTAQAAAATLHVPGKEVAKTIVLCSGEDQVGLYPQHPFVAVLPASHHVDLNKLGDIVGRKIRLATEQEFIALFPDCELGAMPPLGELYHLPVYVDESLTADEEIIFNAGTHRDAVRMSYGDFIRLAQPSVACFAVRG